MVEAIKNWIDDNYRVIIVVCAIVVACNSFARAEPIVQKYYGLDSNNEVHSMTKWLDSETKQVVNLIDISYVSADELATCRKLSEVKKLAKCNDIKLRWKTAQNYDIYFNNDMPNGIKWIVVEENGKTTITLDKYKFTVNKLLGSRIIETYAKTEDTSDQKWLMRIVTNGGTLKNYKYNKTISKNNGFTNYTVNF